MGGEFIDFDEAWAEQAAHAPTIKVFGETITLPASTPVAAMLLESRWDANAVITAEMVAELLDQYVGGRTQAWIKANGLQKEQMLDLLRRIKALYREPEADEGEAPAPEAGAPDVATTTSSPDGGGSKPTSPASTGST